MSLSTNPLGSMDFLGEVPREYRSNLIYREDLLKRANKSEKVRTAIKGACKDDPLYFFAGLCWLYEPRPRFYTEKDGTRGNRMPKIVPFIPWKHQIPVIRQIYDRTGGVDPGDVGLLKSRGEGASWIGVLLAIHAWLFEPMSAVGMVSRTELAGDNPLDPDSLFWKIDWELAMLPPWLVGIQDTDWRRNRSDHTLYRIGTMSTIVSYACGGDVASGGRKTWFLMDEMAKWARGPDEQALSSTEPVCDSRLIVSTPKGADGAYYDLIHQPSSMLKLKLHWTENQSRNRGLYRLKNKKAVAVDPINNPLYPQYVEPSGEIIDLYSRLQRKGFTMDDRLRSPWYDQRCDRPGSSPYSMAQEYDLDFGGSAFQIFGTEILGLVDPHLRPPNMVGSIDYDKEELVGHFDKVENGEFKLWCNLDFRGRPPGSNYVVACDVGTGQGGTYTTNSTIVVIDSSKGEQVAELASNVIDPNAFADLAVAVSRLFHNAFLIWEHNGPGSVFTKRILDGEYYNFYQRIVHYKRRRRGTGESAGWVTNRETKEILFSDLKTAFREESLIIHSRPIFVELGQYVREDSKIQHTGAANSADPNARGENHGDRVIALGVGWQACKSRPAVSGDGEKVATYDEENPPISTMAHRMKSERDILEKDDWDDRSPSQLTGNNQIW